MPRSLLLALVASAALSGCNSTGDLATDLMPDATSMPDAASAVVAISLPETVPVPQLREPSEVVAEGSPRAEQSAGAEPAVAASGFADASAKATVFDRVEAPSERLSPPGGVAAQSPELDRLIAQYAALYEVPEELVRRIVKRESTFNPKARNGPYWGLMQILPATARGMGYRGSPAGLLDAETNLKYAVKYLRGAYLVADGNHDRALRFYSRGYYYDAKRKGLLEETGLRPARQRRRNAEAPQPSVVAEAPKRLVQQVSQTLRQPARAVSGRGIPAPDSSYR